MQGLLNKIPRRVRQALGIKEETTFSPIFKVRKGHDVYRITGGQCTRAKFIPLDEIPKRGKVVARFAMPYGVRNVYDDDQSVIVTAHNASQAIKKYNKHMRELQEGNIAEKARMRAREVVTRRYEKQKQKTHDTASS